MSELKNDFYTHVAQTSPYPLAVEIVGAKGSYFMEQSGQKLLDFISGISVSNLGHGLPEIVNAVKQQADQHFHTMVFGEFIESPQVGYAKQLCATLPSNLNSLYYCTSGSEAVEASMKLAKRATGRAEICSFQGAYHGSTHGALSIMGSEEYKTAYRPLLPATKQLRYNNMDDVAQITRATAGVVVEPIQAASGVTCATKQWLTALRNRCTEVGAILIFDEVQTGFGRTGKLFAFEHYSVVPDVLLLAKAMGAGIPIGGMVANQELMKVLSTNPILGHINTFGGNGIACAAAKANLTYLQSRPELIAGVNEKAELIKSKLEKHPKVKKTTSKGLLMAIHFEQADQAQQFIQFALQERIVLIGFLLNDTAVRVAPPLNISSADLEIGITGLLAALDQL